MIMSDNRYLMAVSIGPVQSFIAAARKLRDLWYGSHVLSELSKAVARSLLEQGCELIFPAPVDESQLDENSPFNVANKIMAVSPAGADPAGIIAQARRHYRELWKKLAEEALNRFPSGTVNAELYRQQIDEFGEFYSAWSVYRPDEYPRCRQAVEETLSARKMLRQFDKPGWDGSGLLKSSLDGIYETVLTYGKTDRRLQNRYLVKSNEQLDAVGVLKRSGGGGQKRRFESFSDIAVLSYLAGLKANMSEELEELLSSVREKASLPALREIWQNSPGHREPDLFGELPCELLYPSRLLGEFTDSELSGNQDVSGLVRSIGKLIKRTREPDPYACILVGDGDRMGLTIGSLKGEEEHRRFSRDLETFSRRVRNAVESAEGQLIFSGGDDVLAFLPLHRVLEAAVEINRLFAEIVGGACRGKGISPPTFSAGVLVAHHQDPLDRALNLARQAERRAKEEGGRAALCLIQSKRSGGDRTVTGKWAAEGGRQSLPELLSKFTEWAAQGILPSTLGYQLLMAARECGAELLWTERGEEILPGNPASAELLRIVYHKEHLPASKAASVLKNYTSLEELSTQMIICHQLAGARLLAEGRWKKKEGEDR